MAATDTVHGRIEHAQTTLTSAQVEAGLLLAAALGFALLLGQKPLV
jgi:hypothetical protein